MLVAATNKEISDLKQQIEFLSSGDSQMKHGHFLEPAVMDRRVCSITSLGCTFRGWSFITCEGGAAILLGGHFQNLDRFGGHFQIYM